MECAEHLYLNFDVNKTCIMTDAAGGKTLEHVARDLVAERSWGVVQPDGSFAVQHPEPVTRAELLRLHGAAAEPWLTYKDMIDARYPYPERRAGERNAELEALYSRQRDARRDDMRLFGLTPDTRSMDGFVHRIVDQLTVRDSATAESYFFVTSFLTLVARLSESGVSFNIIFRTFGEDMHEIIKRFNEFCAGADPRFPDVRLDGSRAGSRDLRITSAAMGSIYRESLDSDGMCLAWSTAAQAALGGWDAFVAAQGLAAADMVRGAPAVHASMLARLRTHNTLLLRDYYPFWAAMGEAPDAGKIVMLNTANANALTVMLDDNVNAPDRPTSIAGALDVATGLRVAREAAFGRVLLPVDPYAAATDDAYYLHTVAAALPGMRALHAELRAATAAASGSV